MAITGHETTIQEIIDHVESQEEYREMARGTIYEINFEAPEFPHAMLHFVEMEHAAYQAMKVEANRGTIWLQQMLQDAQTQLLDTQRKIRFWSAHPEIPQSDKAVALYEQRLPSETQHVADLTAILSVRGVLVG